MKEIRAMRAYHYDLATYKNIFIEESGMDRETYHNLCKYGNEEFSRALEGIKGGTNCLTARRKYLIAQGYEEAVKRADERFLKERLYSDYTPEEYDAKWEKHAKVLKEEYPPDAL